MPGSNFTGELKRLEASNPAPAATETLDPETRLQHLRDSLILQKSLHGGFFIHEKDLLEKRKSFIATTQPRAEAQH
jgi:hypothetical protein